VVLKILVDQDGWYRVPASTISGAGFSPDNWANVHLTTGGQPVAYQEAGGTLQFYGQGADTPSVESIYTRTRTYWLSEGTTAGLRMTQVAATCPGCSSAGTFQATLTKRDRVSFFNNVVNGTGNNFFKSGVISSISPASISLVTSANVDPGQTGTLQLTLNGVSGGAHNVNVALNGIDLNPHRLNPPGPGPVTGNDNNPMNATFSVPAGTLMASGNNTLTLSTAASGDNTLADTYRLSYQHTFDADSNALDFLVTPAQALSVDGFTTSDIRAADISNPLIPTELVPLTISGIGPFSAGITAPAGANRLYAFTNANVLAPTQVLQDTHYPPGSLLKATTNKADFIIISHADFISSIQPLVDARLTEFGAGDVDVVDVQDVYDEFAFGAHGPDAIRAFLQYAYENWANPKPKYVLLVGDASVDPRNYIYSQPDFVPTNFVTATFAPEPPSDDSLADFNGDGRPELAVGRLPVATAAEASAMANKIVNYATTPNRPKTALLVSDNHDRGDYPFRTFSTDLDANSLTPNGVSVTYANRSEKAEVPPLLNRGFEAASPFNWTGSGATVTQDTVTPRRPPPSTSNAASAKLEETATGGELVADCMLTGPGTPDPPPPDSPDTWEASYWYRTTSAVTELHGLVDFYSTTNCTGAPVGTSVDHALTSVNTTGTWVNVSVGFFDLPAGAQSARYRLRVNCTSCASPNVVVNFDDAVFKASDTDVRNTEVLPVANSGPLIVNWFGHGIVSGYAGNASLLHRLDMPALTNSGALSLYLSMTCQNAYFPFPPLTSLSEALVKDDGGAVAVWASSGDTVPTDQVKAAQLATNELLRSGSTRRLGDAVLFAKNHPTMTDIDVMHTWTLIGDPTTKLNIFSPTAVTVRSFTAARAARGVELRWRTVSEADVLGFNVYRFTGGKKVKVNRGLVVAKRSRTTQGASYRVTDRSVRAGSYIYRLEVVSLGGKRSWAATAALRAAK
jgi:hypothetical protein